MLAGRRSGLQMSGHRGPHECPDDGQFDLLDTIEAPVVEVPELTLGGIEHVTRIDTDGVAE